ncbi:hypothetical protein CONLIGDRAFT_670773 [Coniochaeta ligniaria NRRL 30616]|uniref:Uncharacterized protein n=1 Tax=Coniochaeta ligniaria NRRL 30616 TaxID=1408157 RepID=A0A1J7JH52_9PEZI|nr:hypothetical protein CONLIGDRAFT_670773 [Coniochaeta ligniaria NRRL 30616]
MRFPILLALFFLTTTAVAGGIRRSFEIMTLWYTYQARIEELWASEGNLNNLDIIPIQFGRGPHGTLTFNQFVEYVARRPNTLPRTPPFYFVAENNLAPDISRTANNMWMNVQKRNLDIPALWDNWQTTDGQYRIIKGARSYKGLMEQIGNIIWDMSQSGHLAGDNPNIARARDALEMVRVNRQFDYDRFYVPAVKAAPEFAGVTWKEGTPISQRGEEGKSPVLWLEQTLEANSNRPDLDDELISWREHTYFAEPDEDEGVHRRRHWVTYEMVRQAGEIATTGVCKPSR